MSPKDAIRKAMLRKREATCGQVTAMRAKLAQENLLTSRVWRKAARVGLYMAIRNEASTDLLLKAALGAGKQVWLPKITDRANRIMRFRQCLSREELRPGPWGIPEPQAGPETENLDLIVMPGLAFDKRGNRLGYGAGYYDRCLASIHGATLIGLCLAFQIVDHIPAESWDKPVAAICSEAGFAWL